MITKKQIKLIRKLIKKGLKQKEIAIKLGVSISTISYHASDESRIKRIQQATNAFKKNSLEQRRVIYKRRLPYLSKWYRKKYQTNADFRKKEIERSKNYIERIKVENLKGGDKNE